MGSWRLMVLFIMVISLSLVQSSARFIEHLAPAPDSQAKLNDHQVAPSPSSVAAATTANSGREHAPAGQPTSASVSRSCDGTSNKCQDDHIHLTACIFSAQKGHEESFLLVLNYGDNPLLLKVNVSSSNKTYENVQIPRHDFKKINIPSKIGGSSIILDAGAGNCTIDIGHSVWPGYFSLSSYTTYMTPTNGVYVLGMTAILLGGICLCFKLRKQDRHLDGITYQELELGQPEPNSSMKLETTEGWNESWDDDWDGDKAVNSPNGKPISNRLTNSFDDLHDS